MISWLDFAAITLASGAVIDVWQNGAIFATWRAAVQAQQEVAASGTFKAWWTELLTCPFCQSYHVPFYLLLVLLVGNYFSGMFYFAAQLIVYSLAATRAANLLNALLPENMQYGRGH
jgi:hypothetical protein